MFYKVASQVTTMGPEKTSFFQALQIPTKITRGQIEIINNIQLIKAGERVGASEATLLNMLNISPFSYGLAIKHVYENGAVFDPAILDITPEDIKNKFRAGVKNVAAVSLQIGYPTLASVPHSIVNGFKKIMAVAACTDIEFEEIKGIKEYLKDPSKFASSAPAAAGAAAAGADEANLLGSLRYSLMPLISSNSISVHAATAMIFLNPLTIECGTEARVG